MRRFSPIYVFLLTIENACKELNKLAIIKVNMLKWMRKETDIGIRDMFNCALQHGVQIGSNLYRKCEIYKWQNIYLATVVGCII